MRLKWTKRGLNSLFSETEYIRNENPAIAVDVITKIYHSVDYLKDHPNMGPESRFQGIRELIIPKYPFIIWYRVKEFKPTQFSNALPWPLPPLP
ncbi:MAG: type II toxin-antitoxin system RelE/ParE family toxin [Magnetococcales bacterium]|nr:type II toxin-antitoxin system RelE/ParE family toxin [Magnetococcales bacterium]